VGELYSAVLRGNVFLVGLQEKARASGTILEARAFGTIWHHIGGSGLNRFFFDFEVESFPKRIFVSLHPEGDAKDFGEFVFF
jgi:hypothetical protein